MKKLILWDIDGTLLNCNSAGRHALSEATLKVFGTVGRMDRVDFQGKTDPLILHESLIMMGYDPEEVKKKEETLKEEYFRILADSIETFKPVIMPGVQETLELLDGMDVVQGILTGNFQKSAWIKLSSHGLDRFFKTGAFGDDAFHRNDLPGIAQKRINDYYKTSFSLQDTIVIGDTIYDIQCAKHVGATSIALGTGFGKNEMLIAENPNYFLKDLTETKSLISIIES